MGYFKKIKVVELASVLAGPSVGQFFAELGAEVIKVESALTGGDVTRSWKTANENTDDRSAYFCAVNWGKKSVALNLNKTEDQLIVHKLIARADIVIASYKPGDALKLGVDYNTARSINPSIIYGQITGYGSDIPRVGYDAIIQAEAGFMFMNGSPNGASLKMPVALIDILAAHQLKEAILIALLEKHISNQGKLVEVSLIQAGVASLANQATNYLVAGVVPQKQGSLHPNIAPYGEVFKTHDGDEIILAVGNDKQFQALGKVLRQEEAFSLNQYATNQNRVMHRAELSMLIGNVVKDFSTTALLDALHQHQIPAGVIQRMDQVFRMENVKEVMLHANNMVGVRNFVGKLHPETALLDNLIPPPRLGEHTHEIIAMLDNR